MATQRSEQIQVWYEQVTMLQGTLEQVIRDEPSLAEGHIILEFEIPRRQKRPDTILLVRGLVIVIEFKIGTDKYDAAAKWQVEDYALNLRDFHEASSSRIIVPILCATEAAYCSEVLSSQGNVASLTLCNRNTLGEAISRAITRFGGISQIAPDKWLSSPYRPSLTIIEAAERLYKAQDVREINHNYAANLTRTTDMLAETVTLAKDQGKRIICFVTGVPGAGKTLTGLNVVHDPRIRTGQGGSGIFLSGNGPLIKIIREALVINQGKSGKIRKQLEHEVSTFIQNIHQFLRYHHNDSSLVPHEHMIVFDEAQRAWNGQQMLRKQKINASEASLLLDVMERIDDWCVIIALVGGGQEIYLGEAGLAEWGRALAAREKKWMIVASPEVLAGGNSVAGQTLFAEGTPQHAEIVSNQSAHLSVSVRSHRAQQIASWVNDALVPNAKAAARNVPIQREFPLCVTRSLGTAREWLRKRWNEEPLLRCGLVASSEDQRLRAYGLEQSSAFRIGFSFEKWFLAGRDDVRSSYRLEVSASEFECQGLELDWVGVCWGGDLTLQPDGASWDFRKFRGTKWQNCRSVAEQTYIRNRYRVLLTRARAGMVIWVPEGIESDPTLCPKRFQRIFDLLLAAGAYNLDIAKDQ